MALSSDLISQFVEVTKEEKQNKETTVYGTIVVYDENKYVKLDGSELLTPISTTADAIDGERVTVMIKNHNAIVTGNISSPAARNDTVSELGTKISEFEIVIADKVSVERLEAELANIDTLIADKASVKDLEAIEADIGTLTADNVTINEKLTAAEANISSLETKKLDAEIADVKYATIENLEAQQVKIGNLESTYGEFKDLTTDKFTAIDADISKLETDKLNATDADLKYANIDFANINMAAVKKLFSDSGIIKDLIVDEGKITGELVGVTIKGDLIEGNTIVADKLVVKGENGLYYKLNVTEGNVTADDLPDDWTEEQKNAALQSGLHGSNIIAQSITAEKISVSDLVAFDATIGGFNITNESIYSGAKSSIDNTTRGIYLDKTGQMAIGDSDSFLKYYKDTDGNYKLEISAGSIKMSASNKTIEEAVGESIISTVEEFYQSTSPIALSGGSWSTSQPTWTEGTYIWRRTHITYGNGSSKYSPSSTGICITGNTGAKGDQGIQGIQGEKGEQGIKGDKGDTGVGISGTSEYYAVSTSNVIEPTDWSQTVPTLTTTNKYLWNYEVITYTNGSTSETNKRVIGVYGDKGDTGSQGIQGPAGNDGQTLYTWLKYADTPTSGMSDNPTGKTYIGLAYNKSTSTESSNYSDYTWSLIKGDKGETGSQGIQGPAGNDGQTLYTWIKYADSSTGTNMSDDPTGKTYIGLAYNKTTSEESDSSSDYTWSLIKGDKGDKGENGVGVSYATQTYQASSSGTEIPTGTWSSIIPETSGDNPYLWTCTEIVYTDGTTSKIYTIGATPEGYIEADESIRQTILDQNTSIMSDCESIIMSALESYVQTGDYETYKRTVSSQLELLASELSIKFTETTSSINDLSTSTAEKFNTIYKNFIFSENGITIGGSSGITLTVDNDQGIIFSKNGKQFGLWDGNYFYTGSIFVRMEERAQFGNFAFVPDKEDGSLRFLKVGG